MRRLRALLVCPCARCREEREEERNRPTPEERAAHMARLMEFGEKHYSTVRQRAEAWREQVEKRTIEWPDGRV